MNYDVGRFRYLHRERFSWKSWTQIITQWLRRGTKYTYVKKNIWHKFNKLSLKHPLCLPMSMISVPWILETHYLLDNALSKGPITCMESREKKKDSKYIQESFIIYMHVLCTFPLSFHIFHLNKNLHWRWWQPILGYVSTIDGLVLQGDHAWALFFFFSREAHFLLSEYKRIKGQGYDNKRGS